MEDGTRDGGRKGKGRGEGHRHSRMEKFVNGVKEGQGILVYADGGVYDGEWSGDRKNGKGTLTLVSGDGYVGEFVNNFAEGKGMVSFASGSMYEGEWKRGKMPGTGTYTWRGAQESL
ncbi:hypothetical protein FACS189472_15500 [Alphaproteobacteria bacterium]|nr:hypothetical protein FACS189472_15500 [Alphaproteobacteria bacterium]